MPLLDGLRVVRSNIHGYGGVTTRTFKQGDKICVGDGVMYSEDDEFDDTYALILNADLSPNGKAMFWVLVCQTRWFNHSCEPNTEVNLEWDGASQAMHAYWIAKRDIAVGEEITYDYAFDADVAEPCHCGAATCRGLIIDDDPENLARVGEKLRPHLRIGARAAS